MEAVKDTANDTNQTGITIAFIERCRAEVPGFAWLERLRGGARGWLMAQLSILTFSSNVLSLPYGSNSKMQAICGAEPRMQDSILLARRLDV